MRRKLTDNLKRIRDRMQQACARSGRQLNDVKLVAVTKTVEVDVIRCALECGLVDFGESRVQALIKRAGMICEYLSRRRKLEPENAPPDPNWHMIGHLQRNKVRMLLPWTHIIHSLDSLRLAEEISAEAEKLNRVIPTLIEVNIANEKSKFGIAVGAAAHFARSIENLPGLKVIGLMAMAPWVEDPEKVRPYFVRLREVFEDMRYEKVVGPAFRELSMGMSNDFEVAIEEGATMVRIGTALFEGVI